MKNVCISKDYIMHDELCKKNHLSYLDTIESGAEEDIFPKIVRIIYCRILLSFKWLFLFQKI